MLGRRHSVYFIPGFSISWSAAEPEEDLDLGPVDDVQGYR